MHTVMVKEGVMVESFDDTRQDQMPALGETDLDDEDSLKDADTSNGASSEGAIYQDDLDYKDSAVDPIINEETDDPADELGIPEDEYRDELNKYVDDDTGTGDDDMRETIEDRDEDDDNAASNSQ
jgi:hypothetical protein